MKLYNCNNSEVFDTEFRLYCATKCPIVESSGRVRFTYYNLAYAGLTKHFASAKMDPKVRYCISSIP
jgi:hypothetical protein